VRVGANADGAVPVELPANSGRVLSLDQGRRVSAKRQSIINIPYSIPHHPAKKNSSNLEATHGLWSRLHNGIKNNKKIVEHGTDSAMMLAGSKNIF
jgi:hypothetical protein